MFSAAAEHAIFIVKHKLAGRHITVSWLMHGVNCMKGKEIVKKNMHSYFS